MLAFGRPRRTRPRDRTQIVSRCVWHSRGHRLLRHWRDRTPSLAVRRLTRCSLARAGVSQSSLLLLFCSGGGRKISHTGHLLSPRELTMPKPTLQNQIRRLRFDNNEMTQQQLADKARSEERRVGKESRTRWEA